LHKNSKNPIQGTPKKSVKLGIAFQEFVGEVCKAFAPGAAVEISEALEGPDEDGPRDIDVSIRGTTTAGKEAFVLVECKDYTHSKRHRKVGIGDVEELDSKRRDWAVDRAIIVSNSGFAAPALSKARRTGIAAVAVLCEGDPRAKAKFQQLMYLREITVKSLRFDFDFMPRGIDLGMLHPRDVVLFGESVELWLYQRVTSFLMTQPWQASPVHLTYRFKASTPITAKGRALLVDRMGIQAAFEIQWYSKICEIDAKIAIGDYINLALLLPPNQDNQVQYKDLGLDNATRCDAPARDEYFRNSAMQGSTAIDYAVFKNGPDGLVPNPSSITPAILPEDLNEPVDWGPDQKAASALLPPFMSLQAPGRR
jgi:hypothetical protein